MTISYCKTYLVHEQEFLKSLQLWHYSKSQSSNLFQYSRKSFNGEFLRNKKANYILTVYKIQAIPALEQRNGRRTRKHKANARTEFIYTSINTVENNQEGHLMWILDLHTYTHGHMDTHIHINIHKHTSAKPVAPCLASRDPNDILWAPTILGLWPPLPAHLCLKLP